MDAATGRVHLWMDAATDSVVVDVLMPFHLIILDGVVLFNAV